MNIFGMLRLASRITAQGQRALPLQVFYFINEELMARGKPLYYVGHLPEHSYPTDSTGLFNTRYRLRVPPRVEPFRATITVWLDYLVDDQPVEEIKIVHKFL